MLDKSAKWMTKSVTSARFHQRPWRERERERESKSERVEQMKQLLQSKAQVLFV